MKKMCNATFSYYYNLNLVARKNNSEFVSYSTPSRVG